MTNLFRAALLSAIAWAAPALSAAVASLPATSQETAVRGAVVERLRHQMHTRATITMTSPNAVNSRQQAIGDRHSARDASLRLRPEPAPENCPDAGEISCPFAESEYLSGSCSVLSDGSNVDPWRVHVTAGEVIGAGMGSNVFPVFLILFDDSLNLVAIGSISEFTGNGDDVVLAAVAPSTGLYYLYAESLYGTGVHADPFGNPITGPYALVVQGCDASQTPPPPPPPPPPPNQVHASFTYSPTNPTPGETVQFTDTSTGSPNFWAWDFGDGHTSGSQNPSHTYSSPGGFTVCLTISGGEDGDGTCNSIVVTSAPPPPPLDTFALILSAPTGNAATGPLQGEVHILNAAGTGPQILQFNSAAYIVPNGGVVPVTIIRTGGSDGTVTVHFTTKGKTAISGRDYSGQSGTITFNPGETSKTINVKILDAPPPP